MNVVQTARDTPTIITAGDTTWALQRYPCELCGSTDAKTIVRKLGRVTGHEFNIVRCRRCAFVYVNPRIVDEQIFQLYDEAYYRGDGFDANVRYEDVDTGVATRRQVEQIVATVLEAVGKTTSLAGVSCLDVGCGSGALVAALAARGADAAGQDSSERALALAARRNVTIVREPVDVMVAQGCSYDVITAIEVIEHVPHPTAFTRSLGALLKPGGVLLLGTGNWNVVCRMPGTPYLMPEGHLQYFAPATLGRLLDAAGLRERSKALNGTWTVCRLASRYGTSAARSWPVRLLASATRVIAPGFAPLPLATKSR